MLIAHRKQHILKRALLRGMTMILDMSKVFNTHEDHVGAGGHQLQAELLLPLMLTRPGELSRCQEIKVIDSIVINI